MIARILFALALLFVCDTIVVAGVAADWWLTASSVWKNQRGSFLNVKQVNDDGSFSGTYINNAPNTRCRGIPYPTTGQTFPVYPSVYFVTFTVNFTNCSTTTVWKGYMTYEHLPTDWHLVYSPPGQPPQSEDGHDKFTRIR